MFLCLVNYSRPDLANAVRELPKALDSLSPAAYKEMLRVIKFVIDTKKQGIKVAPTLLINDECNIVGFSDSNFDGDKETRISVAGFII